LNDKRAVIFCLTVLLLAGTVVGYAAVPQSTVLTTGAGITTYVGHYMNITLGWYQGATERLDAGGNAVFTTVDTGQGAYELYAMNQDVESTDAVIFASVDTGQGANELYDMDQNVLITSDVNFSSVEADQYFLNAVNKTDIFAFPIETASYTISTDGTNYYAKNGTTGTIDYSGTDSSTVFVQAITTLGVKGWGCINIREGVFELPSGILIPDPGQTFYLKIEGAGIASTELKLADGANCSVIKYNGTSSRLQWLTLRDFMINGNKDNNDLGHGIEVTTSGGGDCIDVRIADIYVLNAPEKGIYSTQAWGWNIDGIVIQGSGGDGADISASHLRVVNSKLETSGEDGLRCTSENAIIANNEILGNGENGIYLTSVVGAKIIGNSILRNAIGNINSYDGIRIMSNCPRTQIIGNQIDGIDGATPTTRDGIYIHGVGNTGIVIVGNTFSNLVTAPIVDAMGGTTIGYNTGFITENTGSEPVYDTNTTVMITHGLAGTPTSITITPSWDGSPFVANSNANNFNVTFTDPTATKAIYWTATYKP